MNKVGISTGFSLRETPGSVLAQIVLVQAMSVTLQTSEMSPGRTWTREHQQVDGDVGARVQETHTSRMQRGEL